MRSLSGILGAVTFLLLLLLAGSAASMEGLPDWRILLVAASVCAVGSVVTFRLSKKPQA